MRLLHLAITALALVGCGILIDFPGAHSPSCVSRCGAQLFDSTDCEGFQGAEDRAIAHGLVACEQLKNWHVNALPLKEGDSFVDQWGRKVGGNSGCDQVSLPLGRNQNGWAIVFSDWHALSYFNEVTHHAECPTEWPTDHPGWPRDEIALAAAEGSK